MSLRKSKFLESYALKAFEKISYFIFKNQEQFYKLHKGVYDLVGICRL